MTLTDGLMSWRSECMSKNSHWLCRPFCSNFRTMNAVLSPIESEFATQEEAQAHDAWFRQRVLESLADTRPAVPHDQAMARIHQVIADAAA